MILKASPAVFAKHLTAVIGDPQDYVKNKESGNFELRGSLAIPSDDGLNSDDIAGALDDMALSANEEAKQPSSGN